MIPSGALKVAGQAAGQVAGAAVELYEVVQKAKRARPESPEARGLVEAMDAAAREYLKELCLYDPDTERARTP